MTKVIEDPNGLAFVTTYKYDILGNLREVVQGTTPQQHRFYAYDSLSRLVRSRNPEQGTNSDLVLRDAFGTPIPDPITGNNDWSNAIEYLANGDIAARTDARGIKIEYLYDNLNRPFRRTYTPTKSLPAGTYTATPTVDLFYDGRGLTPAPANSLGKLVRVASSVSDTRYTGFDTMGRITSSAQIVDGTTYPFSYEYTFSGALKSQTYPSGRVVQNTFDTVGDLSTVTGQQPGQSQKTYASDFNYAFTDTGATSRVKLGNQLWESTVYNKRLQATTTAVGTTQNATNVLKVDFGYGGTNNGNIQTQTITVPTVGTSAGFTATQTYGYDNLNRLTSAVETNAWQQTFTYDEFGNRSVVTTGGATTSALIGDDPLIAKETNRITPRAGEQYGYDATGNLIKDKTGNSYSFDGENMQSSFTGPQSAQYAYDGEGRRVKSTVGSEATVFVYDASGKLVAEYATTPPVPNGTTYLSADQLKTPRLATDGNGNVRARHDYLPFGEEIGAYGGRPNHEEYRQDNVRQKFTGLERDSETGLDYAHARYYASRAGRFTTVDPLPASSTVNNPQSMNRYTYAFNCPYKYVDPSGMDSAEVDSAFAQLGALIDHAEALRQAEEDARREAEKKAAQQQANSSANAHQPLTQQTNPQNSQQGQAPRQQRPRNVALAQGGHDRNAFQQRARVSASSKNDIRSFDNGQELIQGLEDLSATGDPINRVAIHSHGFSAGVIGVGYNNGLYIGMESHSARQFFPNSGLQSGHATSTDLAKAIAGDSPSIKIAQGGTIVFFGCNSMALASHLSAELGSAGRGDIKVVGATNKVYPKKDGTPGVDHGGHFQTYQSGVFVEQTKRMKY